MKAFIHKQDNGRDTLGSFNGIRGGFVTKNYNTIVDLIRHSLRGLSLGEYHIEAFYNWDNRYGKSDIDIVVTQ